MAKRKYSGDDDEDGVRKDDGVRHCKRRKVVWSEDPAAEPNPQAEPNPPPSTSSNPPPSTSSNPPPSTSSNRPPFLRDRAKYLASQLKHAIISVSNVKHRAQLRMDAENERLKEERTALVQSKPEPDEFSARAKELWEASRKNVKRAMGDVLLAECRVQDLQESLERLSPTALWRISEGLDSDSDDDPPDEDLQESMLRRFDSKVLISGMQGLGIEIVKNLVLAGVKALTLHDETLVDLWDLSANFVFTQNDLGTNRAVASGQKLQDLNKDVVITTLTTALTNEQLSDFQAVVFTDISLNRAIEINEYCHNHQPPIAFVKTEVRGLFGGVFCDFGPAFTISDVDGNEPYTGIIASISNDNPACVRCVDEERLKFRDGDLVVFSEVEGMTELNNGKPRKIKDAEAYSFTLEEDTSNFGPYERGGIVTQVKQPKFLNFKPLKEAIKDPGDFLVSDLSKFDRPPLLHLAFQALDKFVSDMGRYPVAGSEEDSQKLISITNNMNESLGDGKLDDINPKLLRHFAFGARAVLNPMAAMFGGIVGQEVMKACSGKFHPLFQFFYFDSVESLPTEPIDPSDFKPLDSRYDAQISVFGSKFQKKLEDAKVFVVGSAALGCEFLKNLALMGVSCGSRGKMTVTDEDVIQQSYLSRQILFGDQNIGQRNSIVASNAAISINPNLHIEALQNIVGPKTENVFHDSFWADLNVVIDAVEDVDERVYIDQRCLYFHKPLLESRILGAKFDTKMVIPNLTENYGASGDPPEEQAPMPTFPYKIDHCFMWARSEFERMFEKPIAEAHAFLFNPKEYVIAMRKPGDAQALDRFKFVMEGLYKDRCRSFEDSVAWARYKFEDYFSNQVKQLSFHFPEDASTSTDVRSWSAPKRFPHPVQFSASDPIHLQFIMSASILRAKTFGVIVPDWAKNPKKLAKAVDKISVPDFLPIYFVKMVTDVNELILELEVHHEKLLPNFRWKLDFRKDDDRNYQMDLIAALANMRARNYSIPEVEKLKAKHMARRIIPAIATSTAMATGLVCLELYKVVDGSHKVEDYRNTFADLALPLFSMVEPVPPKVVQHRDMSWTVWDRWILENDPTPRELLKWLSDKGLNGYKISFGDCLLFFLRKGLSGRYENTFLNHKDNIDKKIVDLVRDIARVQLPSNRNHVDVVVACTDDDGNGVDIPPIAVYFR